MLCDESSYWREIVFGGTVGKVSVGNIIVSFSLILLCIVSFLNFGNYVSYSLAENVRVVI